MGIIYITSVSETGNFNRASLYQSSSTSGSELTYSAREPINSIFLLTLTLKVLFGKVVLKLSISKTDSKDLPNIK